MNVLFYEDWIEQIIDQDLEWLKNDMRYMPEEHLDMCARDFAHKLFSVIKIKIEKAWETKSDIG